jgi:hypothetical protein
VKTKPPFARLTKHSIDPSGFIQQQSIYLFVI